MANGTTTALSNIAKIYQPLDSSRRQIRVLWLLGPSSRAPKAYRRIHITPPGPPCWDAPVFLPEIDDEDDPIYAELTTVSLLDRPAYTALSYTWGSPEAKQYTIFLNGQRFRVRSNLYSILRHLRWRGIGTKKAPADLQDSTDQLQRMPLWIDAVCINQDDVLERNSQVMLMGGLYRDASAVLSWLDNILPESTVKGLAKVRSFARTWTVLSAYLGDAKEKAGRKGRADKSDDGESPDSGVLKEIETWWRSVGCRFHDLIDVFCVPYWERVWIVQEVVLASPASHVYMAGTGDRDERITEAELDAASNCMLALFGHGDFTKVLQLNLPFIDAHQLSKDTVGWARHGILDEMTMRRDMSDIQRGLVTPGWMFVLHVASSRQCSEPRDAVYGLLHIIPPSPAERGTINPDYQRPVRDVYIDWALRAIRERQDLGILAYAGTGFASCQTPISHPRSDLDLPSWVPDLYNRKGRRQVDWVRRPPDERSNNDNTAAFPINVTPRGYLITPARRRAIVRSTTPVAYSKSSVRGGGYELMDFFSDYLRVRAGLRYPVGGMPPLQGLLRLVLQPFFASLDPAEGDPATGKAVHHLVCGFIWWLISAIRELMMPEDQMRPVNFWPPLPVYADLYDGVDESEVRERVASVLGLSFGDGFAASYRSAIFPEADITALLGWKQLEDSAKDEEVIKDADLIRIFMANWNDGCPLIFTGDGYIGRGPSNAEPGDLVYEVKDCRSLLLFRRGGAGVDELGREPITLLGACSFLGLGDRLDERRQGEYDEDLIIC
ncbi:hypothetical protein VTJ83DRAFT_3620 [Remersonia thermophila]|uniref:Heterokaryon incompatibility domain-containing protein n=1 Tax=Remersonia thermophila TaxID=72144 RepID=A0ABR4DFF1_9PEZI